MNGHLKSFVSTSVCGPRKLDAGVIDLIDTKYAVFMDNDVLVYPGWLEHLYECAEQTGAGIVGPTYLWGADVNADSIHMAGGELTLIRCDTGIVLKDKHRYCDSKLHEVELQRGECDFVEFHCMLMRREVYSVPATFDENIGCVHEHIHASLVARSLGYKTFLEPAAKVNYLAFVPYTLCDLPLFRQRWSEEAGESSIRAFANRWGVIDDERSFGSVRDFLVQRRALVDPVRASLQVGQSAETPMQESDLAQSLTGLMERALLKGYTNQDLELIEAAHWNALWLSNGGYRPCGRPFINHLIGTASVLVHYGFETRLVQAALLHAAYTHAPHFDGGPEATVAAIARRLGGLGSVVERAVRAYTLRSTCWQKLIKTANWHDVATMSDIDVSILAIANDTDMNLSGEVRTTGRTDVGDGAALAKADEICQMLGVPGLAAGAKLPANKVGAQQIPLKHRPKSSFRIEGTTSVSMFNPSFSQIQHAADASENSAKANSI